MNSIKETVKWSVFAFAAFCAFCILIAECSDDENESNNQAQTEQKVKEEEKVETKESKEEKKEDSFLGTYEVTDKVGCTMRITLNEDGTATITGVRGEDVTYYCSYVAGNAGIKIDFSDEKPYIVYEAGPDDIMAYPIFLMKDGYLYAYKGAAAKNPNWRLKATKIK